MKKFSIFLTVLALVAGLCLLGCEGPVGPRGVEGEQGEKGEKGQKGPDGTEQGDQGEKGQKGPDGEAGDAKDNPRNGEDGPTGQKGLSGASVIIRGALDSEADLATAESGEEEGLVFAWLIGGDLWVWDLELEEWFNAGTLEGDEGEQGRKGPQGPTGSAENVIPSYKVTFNADNGTESVTLPALNGGKINLAVPHKKVTDFPVGGLYNIADEYGFAGWFVYDDDEDDFVLDEEDNPVQFDVKIETITANMNLKAKWTLPVNRAPITVTNPTPSNNSISRAFTYLSNNSAERAGTYVLYLDSDVNSNSPSALTATTGGARILTIIGLGEERKVTAANTANVFLYLGGNGNSITLGENVTLVGRSVGGNGDAANADNCNLIQLNTGTTFIMEAGSKITGNSTSASAANSTFGTGVSVNNATFIMNGGEITGNTAVITNTFNSLNKAKAVLVYGTGAFTMNGGKIYGNTGNTALGVDTNDVTDVYIAETATFTISGAAQIDSITISATASAGSVVTLVPGWTGKINALNLRGDHTDLANARGYWTGGRAVVSAVEDATLGEGDLEKITLGNFINQVLGGFDSISVGITTSYEFVTTGANIGQLKTK